MGQLRPEPKSGRSLRKWRTKDVVGFSGQKEKDEIAGWEAEEPEGEEAEDFELDDEESPRSRGMIQKSILTTADK